MRVVLAVLALLVSVPVMAEPIPPENVAQIFRECAAEKPTDATHQNYCRCLAFQLRDKVSAQLALTINAEVQADRARGVPTISAIRKQPELWNITQECRVSVGLSRIP